ncbi:DNA-binding GntR family transcriptional regulator [Kibdelosporangium banguiense]|uniref:DNA-binding GntR family transcriptional regulator n=1 Tax=Kibdelosporangium banguiense TaxID=1365924 RepID=A0ABS4TXV3_9PSEU|nr:GntR family transcriptional regulator [Kibdelosporangium banguiense]MBP2329211.1 DNA-binding GntR family transcriptional regulator [Kibdelosporangium banguiense]
MTRQTAAKWTARYQAGGIARLSHPAQHRQTMEETRKAILTAPLWMPITKWSSRSIADALGVSQSYVARTWDPMRSTTDLTNELAAEIQGSRPGLVGLLVTPDYAVIVFQLARNAESSQPAHAGPGLRRSLRTILAADLIRDQITETADVNTFWATVKSTVEADTAIMAVASKTAPLPTEVALGRACRNADDWQSLFSLFVNWAAFLPPHSLQELETELRKWARAPRREFAWVVPSTTDPNGVRGPTRSAIRHHGPERALADQIIVTIRQGVADGLLAGGDRITDRYLAGRLRTTRGQVRTAMRLLERDGLFTVTTGHAAVVPVPTTNDVIETYAARRALGAMVIRAAVRWSPEARQSVIRSLDELKNYASIGDVYRTGAADIDFQNTLAEASGLVRIAPMLQILADHLRMFIAVMGLDYAYPIDDIVRDDQRIFAAIDAGDGEAAVELWRIKMNDAVAYMLAQLPSGKQRHQG